MEDPPSSRSPDSLPITEEALAALLEGFFCQSLAWPLPTLVLPLPPSPFPLPPLIAGGAPGPFDFVEDAFNWVVNNLAAPALGWLTNKIGDVAALAWNAVLSVIIFLLRAIYPWWRAVFFPFLSFEDQLKFPGLDIFTPDPLTFFPRMFWEMPFLAIKHTMHRVIIWLWDVMRDAATGIPAMMGGALINLGEWIANNARRFWGWLTDHIQNFANWVWDRLTRLADLTYSALHFLAAHLWGVIKTVADWIWDRLTRLADLTWNALRWVGDALWNIFTTSLHWLRVQIEDLANKVWDRLTRLADLTWNALRWVGDALWNIFSNSFFWVVTRLTELKDAVWNGIRWLIDVLWNRLTWLGESVFWPALLGPMGLPFLFREQLLELAKGIWDWLHNVAFPWLIQRTEDMALGGGNFLRRLWDYFTQLVNNWYSALAGLATAHGDVGPGQAWPNVITSASIMLPTTGVMVAISAYLEEIHLHKFMGWQNLMAFFWAFLGYENVANNVVGPLARALIGIPMTYWANVMARPNIPERGELDLLWAKHEIREADYFEAHKWRGTPDKWFLALRRAVYKDPRLMEVIRMSEVFVPPATMDPAAEEYWNIAQPPLKRPEDWWYAMKAAKAGYDNIDIPILVDAMRLMAARREQTLVFMQVRRLFREGFYDVDTCRRIIDRARQPWDVIDFRIWGMELERQYETKKEWYDLAMDSFVKDQITDAEFRYHLAALGMDDGRIHVNWLKASLRKVPKPLVKRPPDPTEEVERLIRLHAKLYEKQYDADLLTEDEYYHELLALGFMDNFAAITVELASLKKDSGRRPTPLPYETPTGRLRIQALVTSFVKGYIDEARLREGLEVLGMSAEHISAQVQLAIARRVPVIPVIPPVPKRPFETPAGKTRMQALMTQFVKGLIDEAALRTGLVDLQLPVEHLTAFVQLAVARRAEPVPLIPPPVELPYETAGGKLRIQALITDFVKERITEVQLREGLDALAMPADLVDAQVQHALARLPVLRVPPPPQPFYQTLEGRLRVDTIAEAFREGVLTEAEASAALAALEMSPSHAQALIERERIRVYKPDAPPVDEPVPAYKTEAGKLEMTTARTLFRKALIDEAQLRSTLVALEVLPILIDAIVASELARLAPAPTP